MKLVKIFVICGFFASFLSANLFHLEIKDYAFSGSARVGDTFNLYLKIGIYDTASYPSYFSISPITPYGVSIVYKPEIESFTFLPGDSIELLYSFRVDTSGNYCIKLKIMDMEIDSSYFTSKGWLKFYVSSDTVDFIISEEPDTNVLYNIKPSKVIRGDGNFSTDPSLSGKLYYEDPIGEIFPVPKVIVFIFGWAFFHLPVSYYAELDENGYFSIPILPGFYIVTFLAATPKMEVHPFWEVEYSW